MGPLEDTKFTTRNFEFILDKELIGMATSKRKSFGIGNADMILRGTYKVQKNKTLHIQVKDSLGKQSEYIGTPSQDGKELVLIPLRILGNDVKGNRQMAYRFKKFSG
jgi:hypothetical protein